MPKMVGATHFLPRKPWGFGRALGGLFVFSSVLGAFSQPLTGLVWLAAPSVLYAQTRRRYQIGVPVQVELLKDAVRIGDVRLDSTNVVGARVFQLDQGAHLLYTLQGGPSRWLACRDLKSAKRIAKRISPNRDEHVFELPIVNPKAGLARVWAPLSLVGAGMAIAVLIALFPSLSVVAPLGLTPFWLILFCYWSIACIQAPSAQVRGEELTFLSRTVSLDDPDLRMDLVGDDLEVRWRDGLTRLRALASRPGLQGSASLQVLHQLWTAVATRPCSDVHVDRQRVIRPRAKDSIARDDSTP
jgi:hypothetical protein